MREGMKDEGGGMKWEGYQLWLGDCLEQMDRIEAGSVDMILADLPFNSTACAWDKLIPFEPLWKQYKRVIKRNGAIVLFGDEPFTSVLILSNLKWFKYRWTWEKDKGSNFGVVKYQPFDVTEDIVIFYKNQPTYNAQMWDAGFITNKPSSVGQLASQDNVYGKNGLRTTFRNSTDRYPRNIVKFAVPKHNDGINGGHLHPTQKPVALLSYLIKTYTNEGDLVLDNTCGSGSTLEAAMRCNRRSIGIEKNLDYFNVATQRLARVAAELRGELNHLPMFAEPCPELIEGAA